MSFETYLRIQFNHRLVRVDTLEGDFFYLFAKMDREDGLFFHMSILKDSRRIFNICPKAGYQVLTITDYYNDGNLHDKKEESRKKILSITPVWNLQEEFFNVQIPGKSGYNFNIRVNYKDPGVKRQVLLDCLNSTDLSVISNKLKIPVFIPGRPINVNCHW